MPGPNILGPPKIVVATIPLPGAPPISTTALTNAQLRASPVPVTSNDPFPVVQPPTIFHLTKTEAQGDKCFVDLPPAGLDVFHYITQIELVKLYAQAGTTDGAGVVVVSENLPGNPSWTTEQTDRAQGFAISVLKFDYTGNPLRCEVADTQTRFFAPSQPDTIWRWNVSYYVGL